MKKILLVDDHQLIFDGLQFNLGKRYSLLYAPTLGRAKEIVAAEEIDFCVLDIRIGSEDGLDLLKSIRTRIPTFILTMHRSLTLINTAKALGARGYFLKDESFEGLVAALSHADSAPFFISATLHLLPSDPVDRDQLLFDQLTERERQIFVSIAEGFNYKEIGFSLGISPKTVNVHRDNLMKKLGLQTASDVVKLAVKLGLLFL